jgi:ketosteroid isomerase-like protein
MDVRPNIDDGPGKHDDEPMRMHASEAADGLETTVTSLGRGEDNRDFLRQLYLASFAGDVEAFPKAMACDFEAHVPPQLPWGGVHRGPDEFVNVVLPQLAVALDFGSMHLESISADGDRVAALMSARTALGTEIWIAEHWIVGNGQLQQLRVFYDDTRSIESPPAPTDS